MAIYVSAQLNVASFGKKYKAEWLEMLLQPVRYAPISSSPVLDITSTTSVLALPGQRGIVSPVFTHPAVVWPKAGGNFPGLQWE